MVRIMPAAEFRIKYRDVFHLNNLYIMMHEYLKEEGWQDEFQSDDHQFIEKLYLERFAQKGIHVGGKEIWVFWRLLKMPERKYSGFFRNKLNIDFHLVYGKDQEIMFQGKKIKAQWGELEIFVKAFMELDYKDAWRNHWFLKHFENIYINRIASQEFAKREKELWREAYRLQARIKQYLNLKQFLTEVEQFHPKQFGMEG
jgi:hypothetical protein